MIDSTTYILLDSSIFTEQVSLLILFCGRSQNNKPMFNYNVGFWFIIARPRDCMTSYLNQSNLLDGNIAGVLVSSAVDRVVGPNKTKDY